MSSRLQFLIILVFTLSFVVACDSPTEVVEVKNDAGVVTERYERIKENYARQGKYESFDDEGRKMEEAKYENDTLQGERKIFFENGKLQYLELYKDGLFEGPYKAFHENGTVMLEGQYVNNEMIGEWKRYYNDGQLQEVVLFNNNKENGPFIEYHPNGALKAKGAYLDGDNENGPLELYNEEGVLTRKMNCEKGICRTTWKIDTISNEE